MPPLTRERKRVLQYVVDYIENIGYPPLLWEIANELRVLSLATVHEHLTRLERDGYIQRRKGERRAITVLVRP